MDIARSVARVSTVPSSDLLGPVEVPTGPTQAVADQSAVVLHTEEPPASVIADLPNAAADSIVGAPEVAAPPIVAGSGEVVLAIESPWNIDFFDPSIPGCPKIHRAGTSVPSNFADQAISTGALAGVQIVKR